MGLRLTRGSAATSTGDLCGLTLKFYSDEPVIGHMILTRLSLDFESGDAAMWRSQTLNFRVALWSSFFSQ